MFARAAVLLVLALVAAAASPFAQAAPVAFKVCPNKRDQLGISSVDVGAAKVNSPVTITAKGRANVAMGAGARIQIQFRQGTSQTPVRQFDFCGAIKNGGAACPLKRGAAYAATIKHEISRFAKPGVATATVTILDPRGVEVSCVTADINVTA